MSTASIVDQGTAAILRSVVRRGDRCLEVGCGPAQYRSIVGDGYIGIDITAAPYRDDLDRSPDVVADAIALPIRRASVDVVFFAHTLYMIGDGRNAVREAARALVPGGQLVVFDYSERTLLGLADRHRANGDAVTVEVRRRRAWPELLEPEGFADIRVSTTSSSTLRRRLGSMVRGPLARLWDRRPSAVVVHATRRAD